MSKIISTLFLATLFSLFLLGASVSAYVLDDYTLNFSKAASLLGDDNISDVQNVAKWQTLGKTFVGFNDKDLDDDISAGDTFDNYFAIKITSLLDKDSDSAQTSSYGDKSDSTHEMTILGHAKGKQTTNNSFQITDLPQLDVYFDAGNNFSQSSFGDLSTMSNGLLVETASNGLIQGDGTNKASTISGTFDLFADLQNVQNFSNFELDKNGNPLPMNFVIGAADSNTQEASINLSAFETYFGFDADNDWDFYVTGENDGTIAKQVVPEPATMLLFGTGLLGLGCFGRRKLMNINKKA